jgi:nicotinate-nucleotide adenylyltransferase
MNPIGIFGGTFDPIHNGHLITAQYVLEKRNLEKIIFIPCNISPHKQDILSSAPLHRLQMLKIAIEKFNHFEFSDYEIKKGDLSYTLDTIRKISKDYDNLELIIGYDQLIAFDKWYQPDQIINVAKLVVLKRVIEKEVKIFHKYFGEAIYLETPTIEISATEIRNRVSVGKPIDALVPEKVKEYIYAFELYK